MPRITAARRVARASAAALVLAGLTGGLLAGCASGGETDPAASPRNTTEQSASPTPSGDASTPSTPSSTTPSSTPSSTPTVRATVLDITIANGKVSPNAEQVKVKAGTTVRIQASGDAADEIHVHGYDKALAIKPGAASSLEFVADQTGRFEIETHETGALVYQLIVTP
ncbi:cupredoxin domain-containing protein [Actinopolymorpha alba]|uniref:cupredoxin domain-containing protein n=1 Tax=Actinopolymorpha alba TaxID=533267 RepID=UPI000376FFA3|nr:cupredoxin domain-containing protein [Actinopolymorpha alba]